VLAAGDTVFFHLKLTVKTVPLENKSLTTLKTIGWIIYSNKMEIVFDLEN